MKYDVTMLIEGRYYVTVEADSWEDAQEAANEEFCDADFGELHEIDGYAINATDLDTGELYEYT